MALPSRSAHTPWSKINGVKNGTKIKQNASKDQDMLQKSYLYKTYTSNITQAKVFDMKISKDFIQQFNKQ